MLITLEGDDAAGKSTQTKLLVQWLRAQGLDVVQSKEPGVAFTGAVRKLVLSGEAVPAAEVLLYLADRAQHVAKIVRPALTAGKWVVLDRYIDSTYAYQTYGRGFDLQQLRELHFNLVGAPVPERTILLRLPIEESIRRLEARAEAEVRIGERGGLDLMKRIHDGFGRLAAAHPHRIKVVDALGSIEDVHDRVREAVSGLVPRAEAA